jgi:ABC-type transporter Mla subunit MlaD
VAGLKYPVIRSAPSRFDVFLSSLPKLVAGANDVVDRAKNLLSGENVAAVSSALSNFQKTAGQLPQTLRQLDALMAELRGASTELGASARSAHNLLDSVQPDVHETLQRARTVADNLAHATKELDQVIAENRQDLRSFAHNGLPEIERFVREGRAAAEEIRALSISLRENPAQLLYQPPERGVEIPR